MGRKKEATSWKFKALAVLLSLATIVGIFGLNFSATGNELRSATNAAIPLIVGVVIAFLLGKIDRLSDNKWQIYLAGLLIAAAYILLRMYRIL